MPSAPSQSRLARQILGFLLLWIGALFAAAGVYQSLRLELALRQEGERRINQIAQRLSLTLPAPLWDYSLDKVRILMESEFPDPLLTGVALEDARGATLFQYRNVQGWLAPLGPEESFPETSEAAGRSRVTLDLAYGHFALGRLSLYFDLAPLRAEQLRDLATLLGLLLLLALLNLGTVYWGLVQMVLKPLEGLNRAVAALPELAPELEALSQEPTEFGALSRDFASMAQRLRASFAEQQKTLDEVERWKHYLERVLDSLSSVLAGLDPEGRILAWNRGAEAWSGLSAAEALGRRLWELVPELARLEEVLGREDCLLSTWTENRLHFKAHPASVYDLSLYPVVWDRGFGFLLRLDDVSAEARRERAAREDERIEAVRRLAGGIAHDFNNILGGLVGQLSLLRLDLEQGPAPSAARVRENLEVMDLSLDRAGALVRHLIDLGRPAPLAQDRVDLGVAVLNVLRRYGPSLSPEVRLLRRLPEAPAWVLGALGPLEQMLGNLFLNALHALTRMPGTRRAPEARLLVVLDAQDPGPELRGRHPNLPPGPMWGLTVEDWGVGISPEVRSRLFQPYFTTKDPELGTGLGLHMVRTLGESLGAVWSVESSPGWGTSFRLYFPPAEPLGPEPVADPGPVPPRAWAWVSKTPGRPPGLGPWLGPEQNDPAQAELVLWNLEGFEPEQLPANPPQACLWLSGFAEDPRLAGRPGLAAGREGHVAPPWTRDRLSKALNRLADPEPGVPTPEVVR